MTTAAHAQSRTPEKLFVWVSSEESVQRDIPSALAALETVVAVLAYWGIAIYFKTFTHIWVSLCIAPLLLLRSEKSIELGAHWFAAFLERSYEARAPTDLTRLTARSDLWISLSIALISTAALSYLATKYWLIANQGWGLVWRSITTGFLLFFLNLVAVSTWLPVGAITLSYTIWIWKLSSTADSKLKTIAKAATAHLALVPLLAVGGTVWGGLTFFGSIFGVLLGVITAIILTLLLPVLAVIPSFALGIFLRSLAIRFVATARYLFLGFRKLPENFRHSLFVVDAAHKVELVPGYHDESFSSEGYFGRLQYAKTPASRLMRLVGVVFFISPAYFYRLVVKSTFWIYLPLVYVSNVRFSIIEPTELIDRLERSRWEWWRRTLALATLLAFVVTTMSHGKLSETFGESIISPLEFLFAIDFRSLKPWQALNLLSALITGILFFATASVLIDLVHIPKGQKIFLFFFKVQALKVLMRIRNISSGALIAILVIHALLALSPLAAWLHPEIMRFLRWFYGEYMPQFQPHY